MTNLHAKQCKIKWLKRESTMQTVQKIQVQAMQIRLLSVHQIFSHPGQINIPH